MILLEEVMMFFDELSSEFLRENIPILNNIVKEYPNIPSYEEIDNDKKEEPDSSSENNFSEDESL